MKPNTDAKLPSVNFKRPNYTRQDSDKILEADTEKRKSPSKTRNPKIQVKEKL